MPCLPTTCEEMHRRGWDQLDVIFVTGDAYIDHPSFGVSILARWLESHGYRVGIIPQPDWRSPEPFKALGRPRLFFGVSAGAMDSMVAHYTPARKLRHDDAYTPGNIHGARPNRACIVYTSRLKEAWRDVPVVLGGIEASLRRFAHYDFWEDKVRRSILFDSKADMLLYGMGERPLLELAERLRKGEQFSNIVDLRGSAFVTSSIHSLQPSEEGERAAGESGGACGHVELPPFELVATDRLAFAKAFKLASLEQNPCNAKRLVQQHGDRFLVCNPPAFPLRTQELDVLYSLPFTKQPHPSYTKPIPAWEQIRNSITTHRGCSGGCSFCAISTHQGNQIQSRSEASILQEVRSLVETPWFRGSISDIGGPTANMYGMQCGNRAALAVCRRGSCLAPTRCQNLVVADAPGARVLRKVRGVAGVKHVAVSSGIRFDLLDLQPEYLGDLLAHHVGGLLKVAPEHLIDSVTALMGKPGKRAFERFLHHFMAESQRLGKKQHVLPYLMSGHPGCTLTDMVELALLLKKYRLRVEQVQDFTPTPGTLSTCMYYTGIHPLTGKELYVPRTDREKRLQKSLLLCHVLAERKNVLEALKVCSREDVAEILLHGGGTETSTLALAKKSDHPRCKNTGRRISGKSPIKK